jgi:AraC family transcriptional regulator
MNAPTMTVEAELSVPFATAQLAVFDVPGPADHTFLDEERYWLDLSLTPRPANVRARFRDRWGPHRFERVGSVLMLPRGEPLQFRHDGGRQTSVVCQLKPGPVREWLEQEITLSDRRLEASLDVSNENIRSLLKRLAQELRNPGFATGLMTELIASQMAIELARFCAASDERGTSGGLAAWRLRLIDERLAEPEAPPTLLELATLCNMSVRQLTRGFRASRGCSIGDYVSQSRIETAKRLLGAGQSIKAIAHAMGFSSAPSFSYAFRRSVGLTPRAFRAEVLRAVH